MADPSVIWMRLFKDVAECKAAATCSRLTVRSRFSEPNPGTIAQWQQRGVYRNGVDQRVVFLCESPSNIPPTGPPDFVAAGIDGYRCWAGYNFRTAPFFETRKRFGFEDCYITNTVKCGCPSGVKDKPSDAEVGNCSRFLREEIELIRPAVLACVGKWALAKAGSILALATTAARPALVYVTHYSAHAPRAELVREWESQFEAIKSEIRRRGMSDVEPALIDLSQ